jgi:hypothetical protein
LYACVVRNAVNERLVSVDGHYYRIKHRRCPSKIADDTGTSKSGLNLKDKQV